MECLLSLVPGTSVALVFIATFLILYLLQSKEKGLPPGPWGLPIVGNLLFYRRLAWQKKRLYMGILEGSKTWGNVMFFKAGRLPVVYLTSFDVIHEAMVKQATLTRYRPNWLEGVREAIKEGKGLGWQNGQPWREMKQITLQAFRDFGVGKTTLEQQIMVEVEAATAYLNTIEGKTIDLHQLWPRLTVNIIYSIIFNCRFEFGNETLETIISSMNTLFRQGGSPISGDTIPQWILKLIAPETFEVMVKKKNVILWIKKHIYEQIEQHEDTFCAGNVRDFVDLYIQARTDEDKQEAQSAYTAGNMFRLIMDMFMAGSETTFATLNWSIFYMQQYPEIQKKCKDNIQAVCGSKTVQWSDKHKLVYVQAVLLEVQRMASTGPFTLPHTIEEDMQLLGYTIPRRTIIYGNLYSALRDPKYWHEPDTFNPDRFLDNGKIQKNPAFIPFGAGPRSCPGDGLAKMGLFLVFTNLIQRFTFERGDPDSPRDIEDIVFDQITRAPKPYSSRVISI